jgi:hypothetical protein
MQEQTFCQKTVFGPNEKKIVGTTQKGQRFRLVPLMQRENILYIISVKVLFYFWRLHRWNTL